MFSEGESEVIGDTKGMIWLVGDCYSVNSDVGLLPCICAGPTEEERLPLCPVVESYAHL